MQVIRKNFWTALPVSSGCKCKHFSTDVTRVAESEVKCPTPTTTPTFPKIYNSESDLSQFSVYRLWLLSIKWMKFGCQQFRSNYHSVEIVVNSKNSVSRKVAKEIVPFQQECLTWECDVKKWSSWTSGVGVGHKDPIPTPIVVRNPTPPKNLRHRLRNPGCNRVCSVQKILSHLAHWTLLRSDKIHVKNVAPKSTF